jgi:alpha-D-xyloside xylohydrolase
MYEGMRERSVYLPEGSWKNYHTGEITEGGQTVVVNAPLEIIPVFERI